MVSSGMHPPEGLVGSARDGPASAYYQLLDLLSILNDGFIHQAKVSSRYYYCFTAPGVEALLKAIVTYLPYETATKSEARGVGRKRVVNT